MICKKCGSLIKYNEEYCRKCGALVINFKQVENRNLKNICIENSVRGKWRNFINKIINADERSHKVTNNTSFHKIAKINKNSSNTNELENLSSMIDNFIKALLKI